MATEIIDTTPNEHLDETPKIIPIEPIDKPQIDQPPSEQINTNNESKDEDNKQETTASDTTPPNIIINIPEQKESKSQIRANYISIVGTVINFILIIIALVSLWQTKKAVDISEQSLKDAKFKDSISEIRNKEASNFVKKEIELRNIKDSITLGLSKQSLQTQIESIKKGEAEFQISNKPYVQCENFLVTKFEAGKKFEIIYKIKNLGKYSAKIISVASTYYISPIDFNETNCLSLFPKINRDNIQTPFFLSNNNDIPETMTGNNDITLSEFDLVKSHILKVYFLGEIIYINTITNKKGIYQFFIKVKTPPESGFTIIYNK